MISESDSKPVTVALPTLGCKANRYDSDTLARELNSRGYVVVPPDQPADIYIVNTCTVTREADTKSRKTLRKALRINDDAVLVATGCYASLEPEQLAAIDGVDAVVSITEQHTIPDLLQQLRPPVTTMDAAMAPRGLTASIERTRATVKVQDGCNLHCAFCAVTIARGDVRSRPLAEVIAELRALVQAGIQEIVLTGIRLDAYGLDLPDTRLADLLDATCELGIPRLRLSSLEPMGIDARLVKSLAIHPTLCHHFHICLQSGDDEVLRAMHRSYPTARYRETIGQLRAAMPDATFTTDVIVGFPGESDAAFTNTCAFVEEIGFIKLHIFKFSPRPRTAAATMPGHLTDAVKDARSRVLFALGKRLFRTYAATQIGREVAVLVEKSGSHGDGLTPQYVRVCAPLPAGTDGTIVTVHVTNFQDDFLVGLPR
ncbi:MAG: tRNA (N(6)-L-threonylcarbamoyladenosine(37)-C(2))-methylthiotransferase MtaB [Armatimonadota bacterium]